MFDVRLIAVLPPPSTVAQTHAVQNSNSRATGNAAQLPVGSLINGFIINRDASGNPVLRTEKGDVVFSTPLFLKIGSEVVLRIQQSGGQQHAHLLSVNGLPPDIAAAQSAFAADPEFIFNNSQKSANYSAIPPADSQIKSPPDAAGNIIKASVNSENALGNLATDQTAINKTATIAQSFSPKEGQILVATFLSPPDDSSNRAGIVAGTTLILSVQPDVANDTANHNALANLTATAPQSSQSAAALSGLLADIYSENNKTIAATNIAPETITEIIPETTQETTQETIPKTIQEITAKTAPKTIAEITPENSAKIFAENSKNVATNNIEEKSFAGINRQAADANFRAPLGQNISASLIAKAPDGSATFATNIGLLRIADLGFLPEGSSIKLRAIGISSPTAYSIAIANKAASAPPAALSELSRSWHSISQITQLLSEREVLSFLPTFNISGVNNAEIMARNSFAASQILFFIVALRGGNLRSWIGKDSINYLEEKGYLPLIRRAEAEFAQIARQFNETANLPGQWQAALIPIMAGQQLQQIRAFIKRDKKKPTPDNQGGGEDTRFVLEMELSRLGEIQMDGLVKRRNNPDKLQFDLVIRGAQ